MFGRYYQKKLAEKLDEEFKVDRKRLADIEIEIEKLKTHINSLRGLINRSKKRDLDDLDNDDEPKEKKENNKSEQLVPI